MATETLPYYADVPITRPKDRPKVAQRPTSPDFEAIYDKPKPTNWPEFPDFERE